MEIFKCNGQSIYVLEEEQDHKNDDDSIYDDNKENDDNQMVNKMLMVCCRRNISYIDEGISLYRVYGQLTVVTLLSNTVCQTL